MNAGYVLVSLLWVSDMSDRGSSPVLAPPPIREQDTGAALPEDLVSTPQPSNAFDRAIAEAVPRTVKIYGARIPGEPGYGSGVIVSTDGLVVTVLSIFLETNNLRVTLADGHIYQAEVVYKDHYRQLAMVKMARFPENIDTTASIEMQMTPLHLNPFPEAASEHLRPGDWILSVANAFKLAEGQEQVSVLKGVVSGRTLLHAERGEQPFSYQGEVILIDAISSNPGSPGGALVDLDGRWVGLIGKIVSSKLTNTFLNYAYPVEEISAFVADALSGAAAETQPARMDAPRGFHGIKLSKIGFRKRLPFVQSVTLRSPAEAAGLKPDDLIVSANGREIPRARAFREVCDRLRAGEDLSLVVKRADKLIAIRMTLTEEPK